MEIEITQDMLEKPELWPKISAQMDNLKEKDKVIDKYFKTVEIH